MAFPLHSSKNPPTSGMSKGGPMRGTPPGRGSKSAHVFSHPGSKKGATHGPALKAGKQHGFPAKHTLAAGKKAMTAAALNGLKHQIGGPAAVQPVPSTMGRNFANVTSPNPAQTDIRVSGGSLGGARSGGY